MNVGIYIYENAEVLDFSGPYEVFTTASRVCSHGEPFNVFLVSEAGGIVTARAGYQVVSHYGFHDHPHIDVLIVVGGVHTEEMLKVNVINWITSTSQRAKLTASVCTGAFLLAQANLLQHHPVTTHWDDIAQLKELFPTLTVVENVRWVDCEKIITSGGISAGIDMSLHLVSRLHSVELALKTARQMEFVWTQNV